MGPLEFVGGILFTKQSVDAARRGGVGNAATTGRRPEFIKQSKNKFDIRDLLTHGILDLDFGRFLDSLNSVSRILTVQGCAA